MSCVDVLVAQRFVRAQRATQCSAEEGIETGRVNAVTWFLGGHVAVSEHVACGERAACDESAAEQGA